MSLITKIINNPKYLVFSFASSWVAMCLYVDYRIGKSLDSLNNTLEKSFNESKQRIIDNQLKMSRDINFIQGDLLNHKLDHIKHRYDNINKLCDKFDDIPSKS